MNAHLGIGLIGAGRIGRLHAANLARHLPDARLLAVADVHAAAATECAAQYGGDATDDYHSLLERADIDAVLICSATSVHAQQIVEAAAAGKQIFCEKPIALDLPSIDIALEAVERAGVQLQIGFNRRFDASYRRVRTALERGEIGTPHQLQLISRDPAPPPPGYIATSGGLFLDMAIHDFDMARFLLGSEITEVYASGAVLVDPAIGAAGDIDTAVVLLRFANGALGSIHNSRKTVYGYDQRAELFGSAGMISTDNRYAQTATLSTAAAIQRDPPLYFFLERYAESYVAELEAFCAAVRHDRPIPVTGADGRAATAVALAAGRSLREQQPVRIEAR